MTRTQVGVAFPIGLQAKYDLAIFTHRVETLGFDSIWGIDVVRSAVCRLPNFARFYGSAFLDPKTGHFSFAIALEKPRFDRESSQHSGFTFRGPGHPGDWYWPT